MRCWQTKYAAFYPNRPEWNENQRRLQGTLRPAVEKEKNKKGAIIAVSNNCSRQSLWW